MKQRKLTAYNYKWYSVDVPFDNEKYECHTLIKVKGWCRFGLGIYFSYGWKLSPDDAAITGRDDKITHWLAIPKFHH